MVMLNDYTMTAVELTINVTEFKAKCLDVLARLNRGDLSRVRITKRGRLFAEVSPPAAETPAFDEEAWRRDLQACSGWLPQDHDWTQPMMTDEEAEQLEERILQKVSGAPGDPNNIWS
jgi:antitoxin (DNA-binding transcriptional repressor) of toxin-antitoxin stability system